jgi:hypothetical protein
MLQGLHEVIPLVDLSEPGSRGIRDNPRLIGATARENRPSDASELVGERDCQHVAVQPLRCLLDPRPQAPHRRTWPPRQHDVGETPSGFGFPAINSENSQSSHERF